MKIVPVTRNWNDGEYDWSYVPSAEQSVTCWETSSKIRLPDDYRRFMLRFNGGSVYPRFFELCLTDGGELTHQQEELLDRIYQWDDVLSISSSYGAAIPSSSLIVAETPGPFEVLLSTAPASFGAIFAWERTLNKWGTDGNEKTHRLADSFTEFLGRLSDNEELSDYEEWYLPVYASLIRDVEI